MDRCQSLWLPYSAHPCAIFKWKSTLRRDGLCISKCVNWQISKLFFRSNRTESSCSCTKKTKHKLSFFYCKLGAAYYVSCALFFRFVFFFSRLPIPNVFVSLIIKPQQRKTLHFWWKRRDDLYKYSSSEKLLALFVVLEALLSIIDVLSPLVFHVLFSPGSVCHRCHRCQDSWAMTLSLFFSP